MVQVVEMNEMHDRIKKIRVHDILREFCIEESAKTGFLKICNDLENIEASTYRAAFNNSSINEIGAYMPNLRTLVGFNLPKLTFRMLKYLRVLELVGIPDIKKLPEEIGLRLPDSKFFPPNLTKLKLANVIFLEDPMLILEALPSLVLLELTLCRPREKIRCSAGGFCRLQYLSVYYLKNLREWEIEVGSMPRISKLRIAYCPELWNEWKELVHLPALQELELIGMPNFPKETCDKLEENGCKVTNTTTYPPLLPSQSSLHTNHNKSQTLPPFSLPNSLSPNAFTQFQPQTPLQKE
ncbi:hypothetical protein LUZ60_014174 [Juncus effusus]|nr:hypothetical protein LUZ60_014174 [Juncus effusus]